MSYLNKVLQPGEVFTRIAHLHWRIYFRAIFFGVLAIVFFILGYEHYSYRPYAVILGLVLSAVALLFFVGAWFRQMTLEMAVTNKRVLYKRGFININTLEMNLDKVETVAVQQSIIGRLLDYGKVHIKGTGQSMERLDFIAAPIELRNAIEAR